MVRQRDFSKKEHLGSVSWKTAKDWRILNWGSVFSIPPEELKKYSWGDLAYGLTIEYPIIKSEYDPTVKGQNANCYYTVVLDWEYILERQADLFASLSWGREEIKNFLTEQLDWLDRRSVELEKTKQEQSLIEAAESMAKITGQSVDYWMQKIDETRNQKTDSYEQVHKPCVESKYSPNNKPDKDLSHLPKGKVNKLGNEYFIETKEGRWKIGLTEKYRTNIGSLDLDECLNFDYHFEPDKKTSPPKSRQAKGWVKELVWA